MARLSINGVLGGVEVLNACFGDAVLAPEPVFLGAVLGMAVGHDVSTEAAANDEDFPHFVMWKFLLVSFYVAVPKFQYHIAVLAVVYRVENRLVALVYPAFGQSVSNRH